MFCLVVDNHCFKLNKPQLTVKIIYHQYLLNFMWLEKMFIYFLDEEFFSKEIVGQIKKFINTYLTYIGIYVVLKKKSILVVIGKQKKGLSFFYFKIKSTLPYINTCRTK